ncbi:hypothetical protein B5M09_006552 [Aphanomyces astaci]|uniref:Uncharacterized protein n=1 Tax=Aphanomyces astaci TaxID=112090 RepID=A0A3R7Y0E1_APHAT|nr:hypothetical protein B5M09_006552 [Aphanomyces astaci]
MHLRQVSLELSFLGSRGLIMDKSTAVAQNLVASDEFTRTDLDAKKANNRFNVTASTITSLNEHRSVAPCTNSFSNEVLEASFLTELSKMLHVGITAIPGPSHAFGSKDGSLRAFAMDLLTSQQK